MKIESSAVSLSSQYSSVEQDVVRESLRMWVGNPPGTAVSPSAVPQEKVSISDAGRAAQAEETSQIPDQEEQASKDPKLMLIKTMVEAMTGHKIKLFSHKDMPVKQMNEALSDPSKATTQAAPNRAGYGVAYDYYQSHYESQQVNFSAQGTIKTADGKEISFSLQLSLSRSYFEESGISLRMGDAPQKTDPLVINFAGTAAQLSDVKFSFDLNSDGKAEQISSLNPGSGFLALDKNGDGRINNGSELFGPTIGNGFAELAGYDQDHNNWIDENDQVYSQLRLFRPDVQGNDVLTTLKQANVGAIYLGSVATPFDLKGDQQVLNGQIRSTGVFLSDSGAAGSVQQIDLAV